MTGDRELVLDTCSRYSWYADLRDWEGMARLFADRVELDNTGMPGGAKRVVDRDDMVAGWAKWFQTLKVTHHLSTNQLVTVDGDSAWCDAQFFAQHVTRVPVGDDKLVVAGNYRFGLERAGDGWVINALRITTTWTQGNAAVLGFGGPTQPDAATLARRFLESLAAGSVDDAVACLADDIVQDMPYSPPGYPKRLAGIDTMRALWTSLLSAARSMAYTIHDIRPFADGDAAFAEFSVELVQPSGAVYRNHYFTFFEAENGLITLYRELYDPLVFEADVSKADRIAMFGANA